VLTALGFEKSAVPDFSFDLFLFFCHTNSEVGIHIIPHTTANMEIDLQLVRGQAQQRSDPGGPANHPEAFASPQASTP
jgi:hypothetical protein